MPKFDASANIAIARKWATAHVVIAVLIGVVVGMVLHALLF
jgi:hypothetical protein